MGSKQQFASRLIGQFVIEREQGRIVGQITGLVFSPTTLQLEYFALMTSHHPHTMYARADQIVKFDHAFSVPSVESFGEASDFVRDHELLTTGCLLLGFRVVSQTGQRLGRVNDLSISIPLFRMERLHITPTLLTRFSHSERLVSRTAIIEVDPVKKRIRVETGVAPKRQAAPEAAAA